jgi:hypothetical protein
VGVSALEKQVVEGFSVHLIEGERPMVVKPTSLKTVSCTTPAQLRQPSKHLELEWGEPIPDLHGPRLCCTTNEASIIGGPGGGAPTNTEFHSTTCTCLTSLQRFRYWTTTSTVSRPTMPSAPGYHEGLAAPWWLAPD